MTGNTVATARPRARMANCARTVSARPVQRLLAPRKSRGAQNSRVANCARSAIALHDLAHQVHSSLHIRYLQEGFFVLIANLLRSARVLAARADEHVWLHIRTREGLQALSVCRRQCATGARTPSRRRASRVSLGLRSPRWIAKFSNPPVLGTTSRLQKRPEMATQWTEAANRVGDELTMDRAPADVLRWPYSIAEASIAPAPTARHLEGTWAFFADVRPRGVTAAPFPHPIRFRDCSPDRGAEDGPED